MKLHALTLAALVAASALSAQTQPGIKWTDTNNPTSGGRNAFPWGSNGLRFQQIVDAATIGGPGLIQDLYVNGDAGIGTLQIEYTDIEIRMGPTPQSNPPAANWDTNLPPANRTVVYRGPLTIIMEPGVWRSIGLPKAFVWAPTTSAQNLCIEFITWGVKGRTQPSNFYYPKVATSASGGGRAFRYNWVNNQTQGPLTGTATASRLGIVMNDGTFTVVGSGCKGTGGTLAMSAKPNTWPMRNNIFNVDLTGGAPSTIVSLVIGTSIAKFGSLTLPFDLGQVGASGCTAYVDHVVFLPTVTSQTGSVTMTLAMPNFIGARVVTQWYNMDRNANALGWTTSDYGTIIVGQ